MMPTLSTAFSNNSRPSSSSRTRATPARTAARTRRTNSTDSSSATGVAAWTPVPGHRWSLRSQLSSDNTNLATLLSFGPQLHALGRLGHLGVLLGRRHHPRQQLLRRPLAAPAVPRPPGTPRRSRGHRALQALRGQHERGAVRPRDARRTRPPMPRTGKPWHGSGVLRRQGRRQTSYQSAIDNTTPTTSMARSLATRRLAARESRRAPRRQPRPARQ